VQLRDSGNLELITSKRLNTIVMLSGGSKITKKGIDPSTGSFIWEVETPFVINYEGSQGVKATQRLVATTRITRVSTLETPVGIKIKSYVTTLRGGK
jgi:intracellular multiplication protein IcmL